MTQILQVQTHVLPGKRIEIATPELPEGAAVEVTVRVETAEAQDPHARKPGQSFADWLYSLPPSKRTLEEWEQFDREFLKDRASW